MEQNIETKDVQRTEYLGKNGLDMLWAKVKENIHNQVEVERNRAVAKENSIIDTKADKSTLDNYVLTTTLAEYAKKTDIPTVDTSDFVIKTAIDTQTIKAPLTITGNLQVNDIDNKTYASLSGAQGLGQLFVFNKNTSGRSYLEGGSLQINEGSNDNIRITCQGIRNLDNNANHVYATDGSIADLTKYIKIGDAYKGCIPYYNKYTEREVQRYQLADREGIELSSYGTRTELLGSDISISSGSEDLKLTRSGISIDSYGGTSNHFYLDVNSTPELTLYDNKSNISAKIFSDGYARIGIRNHNYGQSTYDLKLSADGIEMLSKTTKDIVTANNSTAHIGLDDDQTEYTYVAPLENGKVPAEYLDLSQYVLKSVYDEKIAALESRIAALEANHTTE